MQSKSIYPTRMSTPVRSSTHSFNITGTADGWMVNYFIDGSFYKSYGPFDQPLSPAQAFAYLGTINSLEELCT